jgi:hypothetical protein
VCEGDMAVVWLLDVWMCDCNWQHAAIGVALPSCTTC